eukprot:gb/GECG01016645.1/.p1 GENE.gb/GECG01016645.1/~~gb/GECG01016645.1/.p1  ORF type:complete len:1236 (+),score=172.06 gb/GECG01016645.1/:1-3708(+)
MFVFLNKKIAIPNGISLNTAEWNPIRQDGWIACGGNEGLMRILKLETQPSQGITGVAAPTQLTMNQSLEGHNGAVLVAAWNPQFQKLTTSDENGLIIVWVLHKGMWFEEMINNRNKSVVRDMRWKANGEEICIVYEDGAIIVGGVDGNRSWGKELGEHLSRVEWSPGGKLLLFATTAGKIRMFNAGGSELGEMKLYAVEDVQGATPVASLDWYDGLEGYEDEAAPTLAIAFENGRVQLMRSETDNKPVLLDTGMHIVCARWNTSGSVLGIAGIQLAKDTGASKDVTQVQFYDPYGEFLRTLKVPGKKIQSLSWEGGGLRIAMAVDSYVYFASVRPDYKWGYFGNTLVYGYSKLDRGEHCIVFWDTVTNDRYTKYVKHLHTIRASKDHCILVTAAEEGNGEYILVLCDAIGSPVDTKHLDLEPKFVSLTSTHVVIANETTLYLWQYRSGVNRLTSVEGSTISSLRRKEGREKVFHIDDTSATSTGAASDATSETPSKAMGSTTDEITAVTASDDYLVVGRASGTIQKYALPHVVFEEKHVLKCRPARLSLNCDSTKLAIIDINSKLTLFDFNVKNSVDNTVQGHLPDERRDCWDMMWADDNPDLFVSMEKVRMYVFRGTLADPEEPVQSSGYLCSFSDLTVRVALLDELFYDAFNPEATYIINHETRSLRDTRQLLATAGMQSTFDYVADNPHKRLWRLLAESALQKLDLAGAERAFVQYQDYQGVQFVKRLRRLGDKNKQKAEIAVYFEKFDEAEKIYMDMDRKDLAIELRSRLGDWFRVIQLVQSSGGGGNDDLLNRARNNIGDYYADRQKWQKAVQYYTQAKNTEAMADCFYMLDDFKSLAEIVEVLPEGSPLLHDIGTKLQRVGVVDSAVDALLKAGDVKGAVDTCVLLNEWERAVQLAEEHDFPQIEGLLTKYANHLLESNKLFPAIELYRKAGRHTESAKLLAKLAAEAGATRAAPARAKKLYILAAIEVERFRKANMNMKNMTASTITGTQSGMGNTTGQTKTKYGTTAGTAATLDTLLKQDAEATTAGFKGEDAIAGRILDRAWHGAEAWHFLMLAQRQLYAGEIEAAMTSSLRLVDYEDLLDPRDIYSLIALTTYYNGFFGQCSKAFIKLETLTADESSSLAALPEQGKKLREAYTDVSMNIFSSDSPNDPGSRSYPCTHCRSPIKGWETNCMKCGQKFAGCVASGRPIFDSKYIKCKRCKHYLLNSDIGNLQHCPLCHDILPEAAS